MNDFKDLLILLNKHDVRYLVIGGFAYSIHREFRATKDLDIFIEASPENSLKVFSALTEFGAPLAGYTAQDFASEDGTWYGMGGLLVVLMCLFRSTERPLPQHGPIAKKTFYSMSPFMSSHAKT